jgi:hypothetical protein
MARLQREYWQRRNRFKVMRDLASFIFMACLVFIVATIPVLLAAQYIR